MEMQREIEVICGEVNISDLSAFLGKINTIASDNRVTIQGLNADLLAGEKHLHFAVGKALRAVASGKNVAKDPGVEIMRYAAGERQIERSFSIGLHEGENNAVFVLLGKIDGLLIALAELRKLIEEKPCSELLAYSSSKRKGILSLFGITDEEIKASGEEHIPELVIERVALSNFVK
ncbi:KEOPS complex subunit Cgi121 [Methanosarcina mazei]|uniref:KEOPS complex Cgi121-like subunit n=2 Tax=Methanosarcina mazei TaxID=2209 RepID=A0A0E3WRY3_METMZ|nr:KEOPS complex subunit Cgi121 [Methanosarcina mazei]AKB71825.1 KEOPS complex Cgi121-like subunit [Methanosarcina mazei C16]MDO5838750.1 KEOPS complex subunit Cgi121 [Methanosarcina mazei]